MINKHYLRDCYFYREDHEMGATISYCSFESKVSYECPCSVDCKHYISVREVERLVREQLFSVESEQKTGKWIGTYRNGFGNLIGYCNKCGNNTSVDNYCSHCSAKMEVEDD